MNENIKIPNHVAIILDGNGRWAKERGMSRSEGHSAGFERLKQISPYILNKGVKILILGYKDFGRGHDLLEKAGAIIQIQIDWLKNNLSNLMGKFKVISFDNLAIEQLAVKDVLTDEQWNKFYQGDDGTHTMYVDLVNKQFAKTSTSVERYPLLSNIDDMFKIIKGSENK